MRSIITLINFTFVLILHNARLCVVRKKLSAFSDRERSDVTEESALGTFTACRPITRLNSKITSALLALIDGHLYMWRQPDFYRIRRINKASPAKGAPTKREIWWKSVITHAFKRMPAWINRIAAPISNLSASWEHKKHPNRDQSRLLFGSFVKVDHAGKCLFMRWSHRLT